MLRGIAFLFLAGALLVVPAQPAIWPEQLGGYTRGPASPVAVEKKAVWDEFGLAETEKAGYTSGNQSFTAFAYRFKDPTGAMAAFQWQRPADATPSKIAQLAVQTPGALVFTFHNYLFRLEGWRPEAADLTPLLASVPRLDQGPLPTLPGYMPAATRTPNSERYVLGPASLALFEPRIPPSVAAFHLGTEAQLCRFRSKGGELGMARVFLSNAEFGSRACRCLLQAFRRGGEAQRASGGHYPGPQRPGRGGEVARPGSVPGHRRLE